jgi:surface antigen
MQARSSKKRSIQTFLSTSSPNSSVAASSAVSPLSDLPSTTASTVSSISLVVGPSIVPDYKAKECFEYYFIKNREVEGYVKCLCGKSMKWNSSMGYSNPMGHLSRSHPQYREIMWENNNQKVHSPEELGVACISSWQVL